MFYLHPLQEGMTAIHLAGKNGHVGVMEVLKSKVSLKTASVKTGLASLHIAAHYGQQDFVREMLTKVPATIRSETPTVIPADMKDLPLHDVSNIYKRGSCHLKV